MMIKKLLKNITKERQQERLTELYRNLIRHEAKIGGTLFGPVNPGGRREFFCLDEHTWIWHEEWVDEVGQRQIRTTRYDVRPDGILKAQDDSHYQRLSAQEAQRLCQAAMAYQKRVKNELYSAVA